MQKPLKILIVRFSSIGDIVLTTPVIRCLKKQLGAELHYLTKEIYSSILLENIYIDKLYFINNHINEHFLSLKNEKYDYIIDLHNNIRSNVLTVRLGVKTKKYFKSNFKKYLLINFGINKLGDVSIVERYFDTVNFLGVKNDNKGLDYFLTTESNLNFDITKKFITWSLGSSHLNKQLHLKRIMATCKKISEPIVLLGGTEEAKIADIIAKGASKNNIYNYCGILSISESAYMIKHSTLLFTNDSGMMQIGAAFNKLMISFWGCTKPSLGFAPYQSKNESILILSNKSNIPCSKHGKKCKNKSNPCINNINSEEIIDAYNKLIF